MRTARRTLQVFLSGLVTEWKRDVRELFPSYVGVVIAAMVCRLRFEWDMGLWYLFFVEVWPATGPADVFTMLIANWVTWPV